MNPVYSLPVPFISILILSSHLCLGCPSCSPSSHISPQKPCLYFSSPPYVPPISFSPVAHLQHQHHTINLLALRMTAWENSVAYGILCCEMKCCGKSAFIALSPWRHVGTYLKMYRVPCWLYREHHHEVWRWSLRGKGTPCLSNCMVSHPIIQQSL